MKKQPKVVIILLMLFIHEAGCLILQAEIPNPRILEATKKSSHKKSHQRKLYSEDYETHLGTPEDYMGGQVYDEISKYLTLAMGAMVLVNTLNPHQPAKKNRRTIQLKKQSSKLVRAMKGKSITEFLKKQRKDMRQFLQKRQRKLKVGKGQSDLNLGEQFVSKQFKIPVSALKMLQPVANSFFGLKMVGGRDQELKKNKRKNSKRRLRNKHGKETKKKHRKSEDDD